MNQKLLKEKLLKIKLVLFDVDGVLTDGSIFMNGEGEYFKSFNVKDGLGIELLRAHNVMVGVISGKSSPSLDRRIEQLKFDINITGCKHKLPKLAEICEKLDIDFKEVCFVGDDILDLPIMQSSGLSIAPADAHEYVIQNCGHTLELKGGQGVARKVADMLLLARLGTFDEVYKPLMNKIGTGNLQGVEQ
jgi:3-deoxy-D-manno-octulosonate 8-phosphate phosphatase (KDO 8-P phosphatase)